MTKCYIESGSIPGIHLLTEQIAENDTLNRFVHITTGCLYKITPCIPDNNKEVSINMNTNLISTVQCTD